MSKDSLIKASIEKRLEEERYVPPKEGQERRVFNFQIIIIISIIVGLLVSILRLIPYFID